MLKQKTKRKSLRMLSFVSTFAIVFSMIFAVPVSSSSFADIGSLPQGLTLNAAETDLELPELEIQEEGIIVQEEQEEYEFLPAGIPIMAFGACITCAAICQGCAECQNGSVCHPHRFRGYGALGFGHDFHLGNYQIGEIRLFNYLRFFNPNPQSAAPRYDWFAGGSSLEIVTATVTSTSGTIHCGLDLGLIMHAPAPFSMIRIRFGHSIPSDSPAGFRAANDIYAFPWETIHLQVMTTCGLRETVITNHFIPCTNCDFDTCCYYCEWQVHEPCPGCGECVLCGECLPFRWRSFGAEGYPNNIVPGSPGTGHDFHLGNYQFGEIRTFSQLQYFNDNPPDNNPRVDWWGRGIVTEVLSAEVISTSGTIHCGLDLGLVIHGNAPFGMIRIPFGHNLPGIDAGYRHENGIPAFPWVTIHLEVMTLCGPQYITITNHFNPCTNCDFGCCDECEWRICVPCADCGECTLCSDCLPFRWDAFNNGPLGDPSRTNTHHEAANRIRLWTGFGAISPPPGTPGGNQRLPFRIAEAATATVRATGDCAFELGYVTFGRMWQAGVGWIEYFNMMDADKNANWEFIDLVVVVCGVPHTFVLHNGNYGIYTVTFVLAGGTRTGGGELVQRVPRGQGATAPTVTREGYNFTGWDVAFDNITGNLTVTAQWELQQHTVTFVLDGGTRTGGGDLIQQVNHGGAATAPTVTRTGYIFIGWDIEFDNVTRDLTVTARWEPRDPYNGGNGEPVNGGNGEPVNGGNGEPVNGGNGEPVNGGNGEPVNGGNGGGEPVNGGTGGIFTPPTPPIVVDEGNDLIPTENGTWIEIAEDGVPLGEWIEDEDDEVWIFEELPPLAEFDMPKTGETPFTHLLFLFGAGLIGTGVWVFKRKRSNEK